MVRPLPPPPPADAGIGLFGVHHSDRRTDAHPAAACPDSR